MQVGTMKCHHCPNPGHPMFLGMCQDCYRRTTQPPNQQPPPQQPLQQGGTLGSYQPNQPRPEEKPPALPPPRAGNVSQDRNRCRMSGCQFFGTAETRFYCSKCFQDNLQQILSEVGPATPTSAPFSQQPRVQHAFTAQKIYVKQCAIVGCKNPTDVTCNGLCANCNMQSKQEVLPEPAMKFRLTSQPYQQQPQIPQSPPAQSQMLQFRQQPGYRPIPLPYRRSKTQLPRQIQATAAKGRAQVVESQVKEAIERAQEKAVQAELRAEGAEERAKEAQTTCEELQEREAVTREAIQKAKRRAEETETRVEQAEIQAEEAERRAQVAQRICEEVQRREQVRDTETQEAIHQAVRRAEEAERRAANSEEECQTLRQRLTDLELSVQRILQRIPSDQPLWAVPRDEIQMTEEEIGRGGWGSINVAIYHGRRVAAKTLHRQIISQHNLRLFKREMNMAARVQHSNLVRFIGATIEGEPIILSELMETSLRSLLAAVPLPYNQIVSISLDVARGLNYLHQMQPDPVIHRDVSSANVLLERSPQTVWKAKVSDFGSANFMSHAVTAGPGNPLYAPPEAYNPYQQSPKMDVFSFGILLIETCTRQMPPVEEREQLITQIRWPAMVPLVRSCLREESTRRPTMSAVLGQLVPLAAN